VFVFKHHGLLGCLSLHACVLIMCVCMQQVLVGTDNGAYGASVPPEWVRDATWRQDVKQLLEKTQGLNNSQRRCGVCPGGSELVLLHRLCG
jgi:hypothetical protein